MKKNLPVGLLSLCLVLLLSACSMLPNLAGTWTFTTTPDATTPDIGDFTVDLVFNQSYTEKDGSSFDQYVASGVMVNGNDCEAVLALYPNDNFYFQLESDTGATLLGFTGTWTTAGQAVSGRYGDYTAFTPFAGCKGDFAATKN